MILLDLNQVMISNLMVSLQRGEGLNEDFLRHMVLNSLRLYNSRFRNEFGQLVIACDDKNYWRKDIFPYYKAHRKEDRDKSPIDWNTVFESLNKIREELKENFPYRVIQSSRAEADDIIATMCKRFGTTTPLIPEGTEKILILSGDKDFLQLQKYSNVSQYSPVLKKWISTENADRYLKEHILKGDRGDGIPNFLSSDACIIAKERQKPLTSRKIADWVELDPKDFCNEVMLRNYKRNQQLVDLDFVPEAISEDINSIYDNYNIPPKKGLLNFFIKHRLKNLMEHLGDF